MKARTARLAGQAVMVADFGGDPRYGRLPYALRVVLENVVRCADRAGGSVEAVDAVLARRRGAPVPMFPGRLLLQDLLGVPLLADLAALRDAVADSGGDPAVVDSEVPVDLVIDHSLRVDTWARPDAPLVNLRLEHDRNTERFTFLRWCQEAFANLRVVPPGSGIMHQVNCERLATVVEVRDGVAFPDTLLGTDSHTPMVNGIGVLGWGVGGIEAEAVMLGRPVTFGLPRVVGVELTGAPAAGVTPTDVVLTVTELLRGAGVVGDFVEFFGPGLATLSAPDRTTIANMAPEFGATAAFFPVDARTVEYLRLTGRSTGQVELVEGYAREQGMWWTPDAPAPQYDEVVCLDLSAVRASIAGPRRPEDRIDLGQAVPAFAAHLAESTGRPAPVDRDRLTDGSVLIAAIASCTNTSNPRGMVTAGLIARNAVRRGLTTRPWVKTSLTPGSKVIARMLEKAGLQASLDALGFHVAGFGCATCNGMSGPLDATVAERVETDDLVGVALVSSNRNFAGRIHPHVRASYLASPALVVAYALTGSVLVDLTSQPLGYDADGDAVTLADLWPETAEVDALVASSLDSAMFDQGYADLFDGDARWKGLSAAAEQRYRWDEHSSYIRRPPFFDGLEPSPGPLADVVGARPLVILGDSVTTDDISPSGAILPSSDAGRYLQAVGVTAKDFNSYGTRRGNHEVIIRATFANPRLRNAIVGGATAGGVEGPVTKVFPEGATMSVFDAAQQYRRRGVPMVVVAGTDYGCGSSRDWAAKGPALLGVRAVVARGFERIHRSNLVGTGVLPLQLAAGVSAESLHLDGSEELDLHLPEDLRPGCTVQCTVRRVNGDNVVLPLTLRADTDEEVRRLRHRGILPLVWRELAGAAVPA